MLNVLEFLERVGSDSRLRHASSAELTAAMNADIDPALKAALAARDTAAIEQLLGARTNVVCGMAPAEDDVPEKRNDDDEEIRSASHVRAA